MSGFREGRSIYSYLNKLQLRSEISKKPKTDKMMGQHSLPFEQGEKRIFGRLLTKEVSSGRFCFSKTSTGKGQQSLAILTCCW